MDNTKPEPLQPISEVVEAMRSPGLGYERVDLIQGNTYQDNSTVVIIPTRGMISYRVTNAIQHMLTPMNQKRALMYCAGDEVGKAYDRMIKQILADPVLSKWKYILTIEDDNLIPADAHVRLMETIEWGNYDAVGGLYFTKGEVNMPMCYGDPLEFQRTGIVDFRPRDIREALKHGHVVPCNGVAMGCTLYRMDLFRQIEPPWFVTVADVIEGQGAMMFTQDLWFCQNAIKAGKKFAIDCRVKVGHLDINSGEVY